MVIYTPEEQDELDQFDINRKKQEEKTNKFLKRLEWNNFNTLINNWIDHYYEIYLEKKTWKLTKEEYKKQIFIPEIIEFYYLYRLDESNLSRKDKRLTLARWMYLSIYYSKLIYDGDEINPYINGWFSWAKAEDREMWWRYWAESMKFWIENQTKFSLVDILK